MKYCALFMVTVAMVCLAADTWAANSTVVESTQVPPGATNVTIGIYVTNDVNLAGIDLPLEFRETIPGSFIINSLSLTVQGRVLASGLMDFPAMRYFGTAALNTCSGPTSSTYSVASPVDFISPDALEWAGVQNTGPLLAPGTDGMPGSGTPSFLLTFDVTSVEGWFEVDTCCTTPSNHLIYLDDQHSPVIPSFQRGMVTIGEPPVTNPPVAICVSLTTGTDPGSYERASVNPEDLDGGSYDPDGGLITLSVNPPGPYQLGTSDIWLVVEDDQALKDSCQTTLTVVDEEAPVVVCPEAIVVPTDPGQCDAVVSFPLPAAADNCAVESVTTDPVSGSVFPADVTTVEVIATDYAGNTATCYFDVIVEDNESPNLICPHDTVVVIAHGETGAFVFFNADVSDNCPDATIGATPASGAWFPVGTTQVEVTAHDAAGNTDNCFFNVMVAEAAAANLVEVESTQAVAGTGGVEVGVYISNDVELDGLFLPLEFRAVTPGCFSYGCITITPQGRVAASGLMDLRNVQHYPTPEVSNGCSGPVSRTYFVKGDLDFTSPDAIYWMGLRVFGSYLAPGMDGEVGSGTPSFILTFGTSWVEGTFEIDTCCVAPDVHLEFIERWGAARAPLFTKGTVTLTPSVGCNDRPSDVNCDGVVNVLDVVSVVNTAFRGAPESGRCCGSEP